MKNELIKAVRKRSLVIISITILMYLVFLVFNILNMFSLESNVYIYISVIVYLIIVFNILFIIRIKKIKTSSDSFLCFTETLAFPTFYNYARVTYRPSLILINDRISIDVVSMFSMGLRNVIDVDKTKVAISIVSKKKNKTYLLVKYIDTGDMRNVYLNNKEYESLKSKIIVENT